MAVPIYVVHFGTEPTSINEGQNIVKQVIESDNQVVDSDYTWKITTKYYSATVQFVFISSDDFTKISENVEAVLFVTPQSVKELSDWYTKASAACGGADISPSVALVLEHDTDDVTSDGDAQKQEILEWCLDNSAEYVHLDQESDEFNKEGVLRVAEALQMNQWSNAVMADRGIRQRPSLIPNIPPNPKESIEKDEDDEDDDGEIEDDMLDIDGSVPDVPESFMNFNGGDDDGMFDDFDMFGANMEKTIESLQALRSKAQTLPDDQRRELALRVALSFARQVGEDTDEFEELVDDSIKIDPECDAVAKSLFAGLELSTKIDCAANGVKPSSGANRPPPPLTKQQPHQQGKNTKKSKKGKKK